MHACYIGYLTVFISSFMQMQIYLQSVRYACTYLQGPAREAEVNDAVEA